MEKKQKKQYEAPAIEVVAMENEGVIAASGGTGSTENYDPVPLSGSAYNGASSSDLEDMINDILTVE